MDDAQVHLAFLESNFEEVLPCDFYRDLFPQGALDAMGEFNEGMYTGVAIRVSETENSDTKVRRYSVTDDLEIIDKLIKTDDFCIMSPVSYAGKKQRQANARNLYAIVFDLDGLLATNDGQSKSLLNLFAHADLGRFPVPTYIVFSGTGLHLYYMLEQPLPLFPNVMKSVSKYRSEMVRIIWNRYITSLYEKPQFESVTQGFRMVGTITKKGTRVRAFKTGARLSIEELNACVSEQAKIVKTSYIPRTPKAVAAKKWPEWYERRIVQGQPRGTWTVKRDLYDWWKRKIEEGASVGHRYFCVMALAVYARKCGISHEELEKDAFDLIPYLNQLGSAAGQPFDAPDVIKALDAYDADYITFPRHTIEELTGISIPPNKRNGRTREAHMKYMNVQRAFKVEMGECTNGGRPKGSSKHKDVVRKYAIEHPDLSNLAISKALNINRNTVNKWLKSGWLQEYEQEHPPQIVSHKLTVLDGRTVIVD